MIILFLPQFQVATKCLIFLEHSSMFPPQAHYARCFLCLELPSTGFYMAFSLTSFNSLFSCHLHSESYSEHFIENISIHPQNSPSPFYTLFSPALLSPFNMHKIFPYFDYCLILYCCQNVSPTKARIFVCLVYCYVSSASNSTWHVVGTQ